MSEQSSVRNLFDRIPSKLFQPLNCPSQRTYAAVLDRLFSLAQESQVVEQDAAITAVIEVLFSIGEDEHTRLREDTQQELELIEAAAEAGGNRLTSEPEATYQSYRSEARAILRRLESTGWIKEEQQRDYRNHYIFPDYTFPLLDSFRVVNERRPAEFEGMIYDLYRLVVRPEQGMSGYTLLQMAHQQTYQFSNRLKQLQHNIGTYVDLMTQEMNVNDVLNHFSTYRVNVSPSYHRLKTADNIARYRLDIQQAITEWILDPEWINQAVHDARQRQPGLGELEARRAVMQQLDFLQRQFEQMKDLMALIDDRHVQYADYAVSRVQYKVGVDSDLSGQLVRICRELGQLDGAATEQAPRAINELFDLFSITFVGVESLRTPVRLRDTYEAPPIEALDEDPDAIRILREQLARDMQRHITPHKVRTYIAQFLAENDPVETAQLPLENVQDYLMLLGLHIYATMSDSPYKCLPAPDDRPWIDTGAYYCANLRFASTEDKNAANA